MVEKVDAGCFLNIDLADYSPMIKDKWKSNRRLLLEYPTNNIKLGKKEVDDSVHLALQNDVH